MFKRKLFAMLIILIIALHVAPCNASDDTIEHFQILTVNDFHGFLLPNDSLPGINKLAGCIQQKRADNPDRTLLLSAGDMMQGTMQSNLLYGTIDFSIMNYLNFDAMTIGNHEFDWTIDKLRERKQQANFPLLSANIFYKGTTNIPSFCVPYTIVERDGVKIAVIGVTTMETPITTVPANVSELTFAAPSAIVNRLAEQLRKQGCTIVIVLAHMGVNRNSDVLTGEAADLAKRIKGIDLIVCGHIHKPAIGYVNGIPLVQAYWAGQALGIVDLHYSLGEKRVIGATVRLADAAEIARAQSDTGVAAICNTDLPAIQKIAGRVIGHTNDGLFNDKGATLTVSPLGQFVTDEILTTAQADVAFMNAGALRVPLAPGDITVGDVYAIMPFDNTLFKLKMTGAQIIQVLNYGLGNSKIGTMQFAGLNVELKQRDDAYSIEKVSLSNGQPLDDKREYQVVTNDFCATGGDGYTMFATASDRLDTTILVRDCLSQAIEAMKDVDIVADNRLVVLK